MSLFDKDELIKEFKQAVNDKNIDAASSVLIKFLIVYNPVEGEVYKHGLKHILFKSNCILNPLGYKYSESVYEFYMQSFLRIIKFIDCVNDGSLDDSIFKADFAFSSDIKNDVIDILQYTDCFYQMGRNNSNRLGKNPIGQLPYVEEFLIHVLFYQDQVRVAKKNYYSFLQPGMITGMELSVANQEVNYYEGHKVSVSDNLEAALEGLNSIVRYIYYAKKSDFKESICTDKIDYNLIKPYDNVEFEKMIHIAQQRHMLERIEEGIRYGYFGCKRCVKTQDGSYSYLWGIEKGEEYKSHILGIMRREYAVRKYSLVDPRNRMAVETTRKAISELAKELFELQCYTYSPIINLEKFHPKIETFKLAEGIAQVKTHIVDGLTKDYYLDLEVVGVTIQNLLMGYMFLSTLSEIIINAAELTIDDKNQETYCTELAVVEIDYLVAEFSRLYGCKTDLSKNIIDRFIFHEKNNQHDDLFSQPLLKISQKQVVLCEALVDQMNLDRAIERQFWRYHKDVSNVGHVFERDFLSTLKSGHYDSLSDLETKNTPNISVNTNKIEYEAYDGKNIEFDIVVKLGDYLILIELKSVMTCYSLDELENRKENVFKAVEQLKRRANSVYFDWKKFRSLVSINLPEEPFDESHIIKIACTDAYDYTPLRIDDVYVTDDSTLLKYFTNPYVESVLSSADSISANNLKRLWSKGYPYAEELIEYLMNPVTTSYISNVLKTEIIPVDRFDEEDYSVFCEEYQLSEDPVRKAVSSKEETVHKRKKIYANDPCPCGSGKKYKKCCGKK